VSWPMSMQSVTSTTEGQVNPGTLREAIEIRRVRGDRYTVREAVAIMVPLCTHLAEAHASGKKFFLSPSSLRHGPAGTELDLELASTPPKHERDRAAIAPECKRGQAGDARASVFAIGAILYELLTGQSIGPAMRRPSEVVPGLPPMLETALGKALVGRSEAPPDDLGALAQALPQLAPGASIAPPARGREPPRPRGRASRSTSRCRCCRPRAHAARCRASTMGRPSRRRRRFVAWSSARPPPPTRPIPRTAGRR
jgi:hypothetical protein